MRDNSLCNVVMWPGEEGVDTTCYQPFPCPSHQPKKYYLKNFPNSVLTMMCPKCGKADGPGGTWLLDGELAYGGTGRWPCKCGYEITGKLFKKDIDIWSW
jgi:hypothetical protein